ncbi:MAG: DMT family transporter [Bacteroidales bacterium]|jgi:drug/metabolite transporter (DMT)-like permease|nr:DMT family transporter [Bacteroidales bacterium]
MFQSHLGEFIALGTAVCWAATGLAFQQATRMAGSLTVNILRLIIAFAIFGFISLFVRGEFIPTDATSHAWTWLSISGLIGFVFGDYCLFKSYEYISARISMLIMSLSPIFAAIIAWITLGETLSLKALLAIGITLSGIAIVIMEKKKLDEEKSGNKKKIKFSFSKKGLLYALGGTIGQSTGLVLSKYGMGNYDVFAATHIRIIAGLVGFILIIFFTKRWGRVYETLHNKKTLIFIGIGAFFGPFIGVYLSLLSVKYTTVAIASTIMAIIPVLIIPPAILLYKEKITISEIIGAFVTVGGVAIFFV